ncbi:flavin reductase family protein [Mycobacterium bourgelatii]|uniref:flavin reductase family protein n=1 Tax=Mycobacterium bourgelatii TaxID=1273442 RepID=UPI001F075675|nr:flavin reductase family protein [Mycobacterium bourgelatii]
MSQCCARPHDGDVIDESFDDFLTMLDGPVYVVTTAADGQPSGCLVTSAAQTSVQPPSFMVGFHYANPTAEVASRSEYVAVHLLPRHARVLAELFAKLSDEDKFQRCSWRAGPFGMPILDDAVGWFVGKTASRSPVGDHIAYLVEPVSVHAGEVPEELLYLSDIDDFVIDDDGGHLDPQKLYKAQSRETSNRYGMRFTLDVP